MKFLTELAIGFLWLNYIIIECEACLKAFTSVEQLAPPNYYGNFKVSKETDLNISLLEYSNWLDILTQKVCILLSL